MPQRMFDEIGDSADRLIAFFEKHFPAVIPLIGRDRLIKDYFKNPKLPLISVKCSPYHYKDSCVILGDAAHAVSYPPFSLVDRVLTCDRWFPSTAKA